MELIEIDREHLNKLKLQCRIAAKVIGLFKIQILMAVEADLHQEPLYIIVRILKNGITYIEEFSGDGPAAVMGRVHEEGEH